MLPMSENGIFWNVYEQECRFRGVIKSPPRFVRTTCDNLAAQYPDLDEAEMFMRAQFVLNCDGIDYTFSDIVFAFKDFIKDRHHQVYREYKRWHIDLVIKMLGRASRELADMNPKSRENTLRFLLEEANVPFDDFQSRGVEALKHLPKERQWEICEYLPRHPSHSTFPFIRYLMEKEGCPQEYLEKIARDCLHFPLLMSRIPLTDSLRERIQFYKDEVRGMERPSPSSGNSKYLIDLSGI